MADVKVTWRAELEIDHYLVLMKVHEPEAKEARKETGVMTLYKTNGSCFTTNTSLGSATRVIALLCMVCFCSGPDLGAILCKDVRTQLQVQRWGLLDSPCTLSDSF